MKRFSVYVKIKGKYTEILLAEGVQFNNEKSNFNSKLPF